MSEDNRNDGVVDVAFSDKTKQRTNEDKEKIRDLIDKGGEPFDEDALED